MSSVSYKKFLDLDITHNYYVSGKSADFSIEPTAFTAEKLRNEKMVFRNLASGCRVFYRAVSKADANPFTPITDGVYSFALRLKNLQPFLNVTNLTDTANSVNYQSGRIIYFRNTVTNTNALAYELLNRLLPAQFAYDFALSPNPGTGVDVRVRVKDSAGATVYTSADPIIGDSNGNYRDPKVDLRNFNPGKYQIVPVKAGVEQTAQTEKVYIDSSIAGKDVFGVVDIELNTSGFSFAGFTALAAFPAAFVRRSSKWKYYVINKTGRETANIPSIKITDTTIGDVFYGSVPFTGPTAASNINGFPAVSFLSNNSVPFYERAKVGLELDRADNSNIIDDLPNPAHTISADEAAGITPIYVFI